MVVCVEIDVEECFFFDGDECWIFGVLVYQWWVGQKCVGIEWFVGDGGVDCVLFFCGLIVGFFQYDDEFCVDVEYCCVDVVEIWVE